jgi:hypothetical protein
MSSRVAIQQFVSSTEPTGVALGDEWYVPSTGLLYKRTAVNGTQTSWVNLAVIPSGGTSTQILSYGTNGALTWTTSGGGVSGGTAGQLVYMSAAGVTSFVNSGTTGQVLLANTNAAPTFSSAITVASNNVGIGTTNPFTKLEISGTFDGSANKATTNPNKGLTIVNANGGYGAGLESGIIFASTNGVNVYPNAGIMAIPLAASVGVGAHLTFQTHTSANTTLAEQMRLEATGNLLLGTTATTTGAKFVVNGGAFIDGIFTSTGVINATQNIRTDRFIQSPYQPVAPRGLVNRGTGALTAIGTAVASGTQSTGIAVDPTGRYVYVANFTASTVSQFSINQSTGALTSITTAIASGSLPNSVAVDPTGRYVYVTNYSSSTVSQYSINQSTGALTLITTDIASGSNPFSIAVDPTGRYAYVANGSDGTVSQY